jgi:BlaI family penicillinase repressor
VWQPNTFPAVPLIIFPAKNYLAVQNVRNISYLWFMAGSKSKKQGAEPTRSELEILQVLWQHGPSTVRFVNDHLNETKKEVQYSTTLKLMQIMVEKGLLVRDESNMKHVYRPTQEEQMTKGYLLQKFVDSVYGGSASKLVMQLFGNKKPSKKELQAIKDLLKDLE